MLPYYQTKFESRRKQILPMFPTKISTRLLYQILPNLQPYITHSRSGRKFWTWKTS